MQYTKRKEGEWDVVDFVSFSYELFVLRWSGKDLNFVCVGCYKIYKIMMKDTRMYDTYDVFLSESCKEVFFFGARCDTPTTRTWDLYVTTRKLYIGLCVLSGRVGIGWCGTIVVCVYMWVDYYTCIFVV